jgi:hypothetical protein
MRAAFGDYRAAVSVNRVKRRTRLSPRRRCGEIRNQARVNSSAPPLAVV